MSNWYLIQLKRNSYRIAERNLSQQGFITFLPLQELTGRRGNEFLTSTKPLFPGYMFVRIKSDGVPWQKINSTLGVSRLICQDGVPKRVPTEVVSGLKSRCNRYGKLFSPTAVQRGDTVEIHSGALANFIATVDTIESNRRIWVLMDIMGQISKVQVASEQVKLLD
ncbi:transcriptional activator RfaH [Paracoccaceae bacterium]|nr:transcriptional activator RfaH [Paracoccaceae bacterium]